MPLVQPQQGGAYERSAGQVVTAVRLGGGDAARLLLPRRDRQGGQVEDRQRAGSGRRDHLPRLAVLCRSFRDEGGAQRLVALDDRAERSGQGRDVERTFEAQSAGQVVGEAPRLELVEKPEPLLGEGDGPRLAHLPGMTRNGGGAAAFWKILEVIPEGARHARRGH